MHPDDLRLDDDTRAPIEYVGRQARSARDRVDRRTPPAPPKADVNDSFPATEAGDAEFFARLVAGHILHDHQRRGWFVFGPHHWRLDTTEQVTQCAIDAIRRRQAQALTVADSAERAKRLKWAVAGESETRIRHLLDLAASHPRLAIEGTEWDQEPMVLGVQNGIVDLHDGTLRSGCASDRVTRVAAVAYDPDAACPTWDRFVLEICDDDAAQATFLQHSTGYALTGLTTAQCFWIFVGDGSNGKSTFLETLTRHVIPEHSWTMSFPVHTWAESMSEYQRAELVGRRLVIAKESEQAKRLNTEFVKSLTGGDTVNARRVYGRPFTFVPAAKFFLACNHRPLIRDTTHGMWRRVRLVPFRRTFPIDDRFADALAGEATGILTWAIRGALAWSVYGLQPPATVIAATDEYRQASDTFLRFKDACCLLADHTCAQASALWDSYDRWCVAERVSDDERLGRGTFLERLRAEFKPATEGRRVVYHGIGLRPDAEAQR